MTIPYQMGIKLGVVTNIAITTMLTPAPRHFDSAHIPPYTIKSGHSPQYILIKKSTAFSGIGQAIK